MSDETLFERALQLPANERITMLDRECGEDAALRARVEALLQADSHPLPLLDYSTPNASNPTQTFPPRNDDQTEWSVNARNATNTVLAGKYKLLERIGEGGMGEVWLAQQTEPVKRQVAVKLIKAGMDSKLVLARFNAERQALAMMDHPNIAKVLDGGVHENLPYFVMELVKGVPITDYCDQHKLTPNQRLELFIPVCQAIQHAHQKGIIHRDIKPSNVLIAMYDDQPVPKVIDFGVAKATGTTLTEHTLNTGFGSLVGTPQYMSPEQATFNNLDIDTRSDVYSLGVLLYELLTGSPPFSKTELDNRGLLEILRVVREEEPPKPSTKLSTADALPSLSASRGTEPKKLTALLRNELDWVALKALEKDRTRRYETANGFAADIHRYLSGEPVLAHPPTRGYRLKKFVNRHLGPIVIAGIIIVITFNSLGFATFQWLLARDSEKTAIWEREAANEARLNEADQRRVAEQQAHSAAVDLDLEYCESGKVREGLLRLARTLKRLPPDAVALKQNVMLNILVWGQDIAPLVEFPPAINHDTTPDGRLSIRQTGNYSAEVWETATGKYVGQLGPKGTHRHYWGFDRAGRTIMTTSDHAVRVFDVATLRQRCEINLPGGIDLEPFLSRDGTRLITATTPGSLIHNNPLYHTNVQLWDTESGKRIATLDHGGRPLVNCRFSPDSKVCLTTAGPILRVWNLITGQLMKQIDTHVEDIEFVTFSESGRFVATLAGKKVYWWDASSWLPAATATSVKFDGKRYDPDDKIRFVFPHDEVVLATAWNMHGGSRVVGSGICLRGEDRERPILGLVADNRFALTHEGSLYQLHPFRRIDAPAGRRFPNEISELSHHRRFFRIDSYLFDFDVGKPVGRDLFRMQHAEIEEIGFISSSRITTKTKYFPPHDVVVPPETLERWAQVVTRGELDPSTGIFVPLTEAEWDRRRRLLLNDQNLIPSFPFPGAPVTNRLYWLHQVHSESESKGESKAAVLDRLIAEEPTWQNFHARSQHRAYLGRDPIGALQDDLKARELGLTEKQTHYDGAAEHAFVTIVTDANRPRDEYERALAWFDAVGKDTERKPDDTVYTCRKALVLHRLGKSAESLALIERYHHSRRIKAATHTAVTGASILVSPELDFSYDYAMPHIIAAACYARLGNVARAKQELELAKRNAESRLLQRRDVKEEMADNERTFKRFVEEVDLLVIK
jgi:serine/threonine protein kinase